MAITDTKLYQALVGRLQGAAAFYVKSGGKFEGASGGIMELESGFLFYFEDSDQTVDTSELRTLSNRIKAVTYGCASVSTAGGDFSVLNLPSTVGLVTLSMTSNGADISFYMTSCVAGQDVWVRLQPGSCVSGKVALQFSGCSFVGSLGLAMTSISLYNSAASCGAVHLICFEDDEWTIVGHLGDNTTES